MEIYEETEEIIGELELLGKPDEIKEAVCFLLKNYKGTLKELVVAPSSHINNGVLEGQLFPSNVDGALKGIYENRISRLDAMFEWRGKETRIQYDNYVGRSKELENAIKEYEGMLYQIRRAHMPDEQFGLVAYMIDDIKNRFEKAFIYIRVSKSEKKISFIN